MARLFARQRARCSWDPTEIEGPLKGASLREWEVGVILCSQYAEIDDALRLWLEAPTDRTRWPWPDDFSSQRALFTAEEARQSVANVVKLFHDEISAIRQTLDVPIEAFGGITRNVLLATHGQRLRWVVSLLGHKRALQEIARLT